MTADREAVIAAQKKVVVTRARCVAAKNALGRHVAHGGLPTDLCGSDTTQFRGEDGGPETFEGALRTAQEVAKKARMAFRRAQAPGRPR